MLAGADLLFDAGLMAPLYGRSDTCHVNPPRQEGGGCWWVAPCLVLEVEVGMLVGHRTGYTVVSCAGS